MSFQFTVKDLPLVAKYYAAAFVIGGQNYWIGILREAGEFETYPVAGIVDFFSVYLYDSSGNYLGVGYARSMYYGITVHDSRKYGYSWATGQFQEIEPEVPPAFQITNINLSNFYVTPGEFFLATFNFSYTGPETIGGIGLKVTLNGTSWIQSTSVYASGNYSRDVRCDVPIIMPTKLYDITCEVGKYPWEAGVVYDKKVYEGAIHIGEVPPEDFLGTIIKKELEYNGIRQAIPAISVPLGESAIISIFGRNDGIERHRMGISWIVRAPSGGVVEQYPLNWQAAVWGVAPGSSHQFIGGRFTLDEEGAYTIEVHLWMDINNPTIVDSYIGELCVVVPAIPPVFNLIQDYSYPLAATYNGYVEECTFTFSLLPEQIPGTDWFKDQIINAFEDEIVKEGASMISLKVYEDTTPALHTDYLVRVVSTASPVPWTLIIVAVLAILFLVSLTFTIKEIRRLWHGEPGEPALTDWLPMIAPLLIIGLMVIVIPKIIKVPKAAKEVK